MNQSIPGIKLPKEKPYFIGKKVLITGASSGLGRTLTYWYLNNGAKVVLVGKDQDGLCQIGE